MRRPVAAAAVITLVLIASACGGVRSPEAPDVPPLPRGSSAMPPKAPGARGRIVVVTHGQASDPFWAVVRRGIDDAARQLDISVAYEAPDSYDVARMRALIDAAVATHPAGIVVSLPDPHGLAPAVHRALRAGIPVISINSGADSFRALGIPVHVGQLEFRAGFLVGSRLARAGVGRALCVIHEAGNQALAARCSGVAAALRRAGAHLGVLTVNLQDPVGVDRAIAEALHSGRYDALVTLGGASIARLALSAIRADHLAGKITYATFGLGPDVLRAVRAGRIVFAVDQQPYLQGYLPIVLLEEEHRYGVLPVKGTLIQTGPVFVTKENAGRILALTLRGFR